MSQPTRSSRAALVRSASAHTRCSPYASVPAAHPPCFPSSAAPANRSLAFALRDSCPSTKPAPTPCASPDRLRTPSTHPVPSAVPRSSNRVAPQTAAPNALPPNPIGLSTDLQTPPAIPDRTDPSLPSAVASECLDLPNSRKALSAGFRPAQSARAHLPSALRNAPAKLKAQLYQQPKL